MEKKELRHIIAELSGMSKKKMLDPALLDHIIWKLQQDDPKMRAENHRKFCRDAKVFELNRHADKKNRKTEMNPQFEAVLEFFPMQRRPEKEEKANVLYVLDNIFLPIAVLVFSRENQGRQEDYFSSKTHRPLRLNGSSGNLQNHRQYSLREMKTTHPSCFQDITLIFCPFIPSISVVSDSIAPKNKKIKED